MPKPSQKTPTASPVKMRCVPLLEGSNMVVRPELRIISANTIASRGIQKKNNFRSWLSSILSIGLVVGMTALDDELAVDLVPGDCCSKCRSAAASAAACNVEAFFTLQSSAFPSLSSGYKSPYAGGDDGAGDELPVRASHHPSRWPGCCRRLGRCGKSALTRRTIGYA